MGVQHRLVGLLAVILVGLSLVGCERQSPVLAPPADRGRPPVEKPAPELISTQAAFIEVSAKVTPSVVNISAARSSAMPDIGPLFENFFGSPFRGQRQEQSLGSGFLISADGYILTNEHVVKGAEEIKVKLSDQRTYVGTLVGVDPRTDVAVLKIEAGETLPAAVLGDSDQLKVGQWALAIGNPFGLDRTLTVGVISAIGRADVGIEDYEDFIQTDASINPGNSGGPLLNIYGEVVGINTAIVASGQGIGFAIPINLAQLIARQLIDKGEVSRGWLGVSIQPLTPELATSFGLERQTGVLVNQVLADGPAAQAGIRRGDILLTLGGKEVKGVRELQLLVASAPVGETVAVEILREGKRQTLQVRVAPQDSGTLASAPANQIEVFGLQVVAEPGSGVLVAAVDPAGPAARAGVQPGDLILVLNQEEISDLASFNRAVKRAENARNAVMLIQREQMTLYVAFPLR